jgi:transcriptional regulator with XRE-family HTH domain
MPRKPTTLQAIADTVPARMAKFRHAAKLSRREAAKRAGIAQPEWSRFESGERLPNLLRLAAIADTLGQRPRAFLP